MFEASLNDLCLRDVTEASLNDSICVLMICVLQVFIVGEYVFGRDKIIILIRRVYQVRNAFQTGRTCIRNGLTRKLPNKYVNVTRPTTHHHILTIAPYYFYTMWDYVI